jgi:hypothetical protein
VTPRRDLSFADGIGVGIGGLMMLPLLFFAITGADFLAMYKSSTMQLPMLTRVVLHPVWSIGVPVALVLGFGCAIYWRPRLVILGLGLLSIVLAVVTYLGVYQPVYALAGNIR